MLRSVGDYEEILSEDCSLVILQFSQVTATLFSEKEIIL